MTGTAATSIPAAGVNVRILRGQPNDAELAALLAVLHTVAAGAEPGAPPAGPRQGWADPARALRLAPRPGAGAWSARRQ